MVTALLALVALFEVADEVVTALLALVALLKVADKDVTVLLAVSVFPGTSSIARASAVAKTLIEAIEATESLVVAASTSVKTIQVKVEAVLKTTAIETTESTVELLSLRGMREMLELSEVRAETP